MSVLRYNGNAYPLVDDMDSWEIGEVCDVEANFGKGLGDMEGATAGAAVAWVSMKRVEPELTFAEFRKIPVRILTEAGKEARAAREKAATATPEPLDDGTVMSPTSAGSVRSVVRVPAQGRKTKRSA